MNKAEVFSELANAKHIVFSGKEGQALMHQMIDLTLEEKKK